MKFQINLAGARKALPLVLLRVGLVLALLQVAYLLIANTLLLTPLLRSLLNPADDIEIEYDWAYSPWPGRIQIKNLALRVEDYNVQFFVGVERGTLDVRLEELAARRFHAVKVVATGTTYRMRHKVHEVGKDARRLAAYPPIAGFADPPLYRGPPPPPIPDSEYALWDVRIENVTAALREVWILEYRYRGDGRAWGSFHVLPARWYEVQPAGLELERGTLTVAGVPVAERVNLVVKCQVLGTDPQRGTGLEPLRTLFATISGTLERGDLRFLDVYLEPLGASATGGADVRLGIGMDAGVLREHSRIAVETRGLTVRGGRIAVQGSPTLELTVPREAGPSNARVEVKAERLTLLGPAERVPSPFVESANAGVTLTRDLSRPLRVLGAKVNVPKAVVPELAWFEPLFAESGQTLRLRGEGTAKLSLERGDTQRLQGEAQANLRGLKVERGPLRLGGHFSLNSRFEAPRSLEKEVTFQTFRLSAEGVTLSTGDRPTPPWGATISSDDAQVSFEPVRASGSVGVQVTRAEPLLPLVVHSGVLRELLVAGLGLKAITARTVFEVEPDHVRLEVREARSGAVKARGFLQSQSGKGPNARFLFATGVANVGVRIDDGETSVKPLVSDEWLPKGTFVLPRARPQETKQSAAAAAAR